MRRVGPGRRARIVRNAREPADAVGAGIVGIADGLVRVRSRRDAVERIVAVSRHLAARVGARLRVAAGVINVRGHARVRRSQLREIAEAVVGIARHESARIGDRNQVVARVVPQRRDAGCRISRLLQPIELVVAVRGRAAEWRGGREQIAVVVVSERGGHRRRVGRSDLLLETVQGVDCTEVQARNRPRGIQVLFLDAVAHRIERVHDAVVLVVRDLRQPVRRIVGVFDETAVRRGHALEEPSRPVVETRGLAADRAAGQALPQIIGQRRQDTVRIDDRERLAVDVVGRIGRYVTGRIRHRRELPAFGAGRAGVIRVRGDVRDVGARPVLGQHPAVAVVSPGPGA